MRGWIGWPLAMALVGCVPAGGGGGGDPRSDGRIEGDGATDGSATDGGAMDGGAMDGAPDGGDPGDGPPPDVPPAQPGAPRILSLQGDTDRLTEGEALTISAVVTDEDGVDDVIGGVLETPEGRSLGAFEATGPGTFRVTVDWPALHRAAPIEFFGEQQRVLWGRFFDQAGLEGVGSLPLTLFCVGGGACDGSCADLLGDTLNCGGCGVVCPAIGEGEATCVDGACGGACPGGARLCGAVCVDVADDPAHCGDCGVVCPAIEGGSPACVGGTCGGLCPGGGEACDGVCVDSSSDVAHCGGCDIACPDGGGGIPRCVGGECLAPCAPAERLCGDRCVDPSGDAAHCGGCDRPCDAGASCEAGRCVLDCGPDARACGDACAPCPVDGVDGTACAGDTCVAAACEEGYARVDGACTAYIDNAPLAFVGQSLRGGPFPPVDVDLAFDRDGAPILMVGVIESDREIRLTTGQPQPAGWDFDGVDIRARAWDSMRVGIVPLDDGRWVLGFGYSANEGTPRLGGGIVIRGPDGDQQATIPANIGGALWNFSTAAVDLDGVIEAQIGISLDNPVNRSISRYRWTGVGVEVIDPFINGFVVHALDADGTAHFAYQPDLGGAVTWRRGVEFAGRLVEPIGEGAALIGGLRVGPRGPVIAYAREPDAILRIARRSNGRWILDTVDPAVVGGQFEGFDLELDDEGWPVLCYWRVGAFWTARLGPDGWARAASIPAPGGLSRCAVAVDPADGLAVAVAHMVPNGQGTYDTTIRYRGLGAPPGR